MYYSFIKYKKSLNILSYLLLTIFPTSFVKATGVIHGKYTDNIKNYHLAVPHKATSDGDFDSFHLPHFHDYDAKEFMKRRKREIDDADAVHYGISVDNKLHHVELWPNRDFLHPQAMFERRDPTIPVKDRDVRGVRNKKMCYYMGRVRGEDNSRAALSTCDGLTGYIHMGKKMYFIEPVREHAPNEKGHHLHVVYPPGDERAEKFCGVKNSPQNWEKSIKRRIREEYTNGKNIFKRQSFEVVPQWMETLLVIDKKMIMKHKGKRDLEQWLLTIFSVVKSYYSDSSMTGVLQPVLVRVVLLEKEEEEIDLTITEECDKTLDNFCAWTAKLQVEDETHPNHFDVAVLLSDWDFCDTGEDCLTQGLAYTGGACSKDHSNCQLNEDKGMITTVIVSHEQGHLLGMEHDGQPPVTCAPNDTTDGSWYVMSPIGNLYTLRWSPCSTAYMRQLAEAHLLDCFNDEPSNDDYALGDPMPGVLYDVDEQCKMFMRDTSTALGSCNKKNMKCDQMWCKNEKGCWQWAHQELADGTPCGENKWCFKRSCEVKGTRPSAVDGGWGEWGEWTKCTKTCGRGVQYQTRLCDNPKPENHGAYCVGKSKEFRICNPQECPIDTPSFRETQCKELFPKSSLVADGTYTVDDLVGPVFKAYRPCGLFCLMKTGEKEKIASVIEDGAKCQIGNPMMMCISGGCVEVGCDGKFTGSEAIMDQCGICNGDGTMCNQIEGNDTTGYKGYLMVAVVPTGAKKVKFEELEPNANFLALGKPDNGTVYFNGNFSRKFGGIYPLGEKNQSFFLYTRTPAAPPDDLESIIWDVTKEDIGLYIAYRTKKFKKPVKWSWIVSSDSPTREAKYRWEITDYKECSAKCEGGVQEPIISCFEDLAGRVAEKFCDKLEKPTQAPLKCNEQPCKPEWKVGEWGPCRACKKKGGVRVRPVECIKNNPKPNGDDILSEDSECPAPKPGSVQLCETRKKCASRKRKAPYVPAKFQESVWQQMNKLHLIKKRGVQKPKVYLKGHSPTTMKCTIKFDWTPPPLNISGGRRHIAIDRIRPEDEGDIVQVEMKQQTLNDSEIENKMEGPGEDTMIVPGTTVLVKHHTFPKRYNSTVGTGKTRKHANKTTTAKP